MLQQLEEIVIYVKVLINSTQPSLVACIFRLLYTFVMSSLCICCQHNVLFYVVYKLLCRLDYHCRFSVLFLRRR